ncbi:hypothetical protein FA014_02030 [Cellulomonas hominis]|uniref:Uncharacterized protein n=1 Tax=Cellulomonas hominis TaxID=156981 RepID=A0A7Z8K1Q4_9CELL|nr:hypothetical protein [Cellulomonas hominis]TKR27159.1 hypothetical protein FA014_02030 [Cellulomonas hominis]
MATKRVKVRDLLVGQAIEYRRADGPSWIAPYRGRVRSVLIRPNVGAVVALDPLTPEERGRLGPGNHHARAYLDRDREVDVLDLPGATTERAARTMLARPRVPIRRTPEGVLAECRHCPWTLTGKFPAEIEQTVAHHRDQHRLGQLEVTHD